METVLVKLPNELSVALMCIAGQYGNGDERKKNIEALGLNYEKVRKCVNTLCKLMEEL